ncbi:MAG: T9SS type A sorting domain-containing protein [Brumimicrobium sp.]|nr:T9SS type A sorting domain-containing protein [Brumimicrobium sp.]
MRKIVILIALINVIVYPLLAQTTSEIYNKRSDTIDVLNYAIKLDFLQMSQQKLFGECSITFKAKMNNVNSITFDLQGLTVDAVEMDGDPLTFSHVASILKANFVNPLNIGDEKVIAIQYHGIPETDPSGFGGFYFQGDYAYNEGVGFADVPHNYGRVWHPCFDNFVERATYDFEIISPTGYTAYCNGFIVKDSVGPANENIRFWKMEEEIPSYLACVGVAPYTHVNQSYMSVLDSHIIPIMLTAKPQDTTKLKNSFIHLPNALATYETRFGPYLWNKVGYTAVPFNAGAMEHATNIMYPLFAIDGNLTYETMMAHELSHHWWGDLVTCRTAEDMWINEGTASYSEALFLEDLYGYDKYISNIKSTHLDVIQKAHYNDGGFYPLSGVPENVTYGSHSYSKGATMFHNMRTYLGDAAFFNGLKSVLNAYQYKDIDALEFRDALTAATGVDMHAFFDDYILNPGFNGFEVDSFIVTPQGGQFKVDVSIQQKLFQAPHMFTDVPVEITFMDANWNQQTFTKVCSGEYTNFTQLLPFHPVMVYLNGDDKLVNAVTGEELIVKSNVTKNLNYAYFTLKVENESDSSFVRIEHYRLAPDTIRKGYIRDALLISPNRYWKIDGIFSNSFKASGQFIFSGKDAAGGNLDNELLQLPNGQMHNEDSLVVLWRANQSEEWSVYDYFTVVSQGSKTDGSGRINLTEIHKGEYTLAIARKPLWLEKEKPQGKVKIYPNPAKKKIRIELSEQTKQNRIKIYDAKGALVLEETMNEAQNVISIEKLRAGVYSVSVFVNEEHIGSQKLIIE